VGEEKEQRGGYLSCIFPLQIAEGTDIEK